MDKHRYLVIMAGGGSNRFWPASREATPKQFLDIIGTGSTFLQSIYDKGRELVPAGNIIVITLDRFADIVREQLPSLPEENLLREPLGRNTAPCIVYATYEILRRDPEAVVAVSPADIFIKDSASFAETISKAFDYVTAHPVLMTLGVVPSRPDPNYGYIQISGGSHDSSSPAKVKTFVEKPSEDLARVFCKSGEFYWNSGIFLWKASVIRKEMELHIPTITGLFKGWETALGTPAESAFIESAYAGCARLSIDYGVMEKTDKAWLLPVSFGWADIDGWESLYNNAPSWHSGNITNSRSLFTDQVEGSIIVSSSKGKVLAVKGLKDFLVIDTPDALLICPREDYKDFLAGKAQYGYELKK